jgi:hypothetical protein
MIHGNHIILRYCGNPNHPKISQISGWLKHHPQLEVLESFQVWQQGSLHQICPWIFEEGTHWLYIYAVEDAARISGVDLFGSNL